MSSHSSKMTRSIPYDISFYVAGITAILILIQHIFNITNIWLQVTTVLAMPFLFTYASGLFLMRIVKVRKLEENGTLFRVISYSLLGLAFTESVFLILGIFKLFTFEVLIGFFLFLLLIYAIRNIGLKSIIPGRKLLSSTAWVVIASFFSLAISFWIRPLDSFPYMVGWDTFTHLLTMNTMILQGGISELNLSYLPTTHYLFAASSVLGNVDPYNLLWGSVYFIFPLTGASLYLMGKKLSGNNFVGLATALFGVTMGVSNETLGILFPYPSTMGLIIMILANTILLTTQNKKFLIIYLISTLLTYEFALLPNLIIIMSMMFFKQTKRKFFLSLILSILVFISIIYIARIVVLKIGTDTLSNILLWKILTNGYFGELGLVLLVFGIYFMLTYKFFDRKVIVLLINGTMIALIMFLLPGSSRLEEFLRPTAAFIMGCGMGQLCVHIPKIIKIKMNLNKMVKS